MIHTRKRHPRTWTEDSQEEMNAIGAHEGDRNNKNGKWKERKLCELASELSSKLTTENYELQTAAELASSSGILFASHVAEKKDHERLDCQSLFVCLLYSAV